MKREYPDIRWCDDDASIMSTLHVMKQLRNIEEQKYLEKIYDLKNTGYHLAAIYDDNTCVGLVGFTVDERLSVGKLIYVADLVVDERYRSCNYGEQLMDWVKLEAKNLGCNAIVLDSGVQRARAHKFYFNQGFQITSYNFKLFSPVKPKEIEKEDNALSPELIPQIKSRL